MVTLSEQELKTLSSMRSEADAGVIGYWEIYEWLADLLVESKGVAVDDQTVLWLRGATEANADRGSMAAIIRDFTNEEYRLRYGSNASEDDMQRASDTVAGNLIADLLGERRGWVRGDVPDIDRIAFSDATGVGEVLFNADRDDTAAEKGQNSAWAGTLLFNLLRNDQTGRLYSTADGDELDTLNDFRDVLYAASSYYSGMKSAAAEMVLNASYVAGWFQLRRDIDIFGSTIGAYMLHGSGELIDTLKYGAAFGPVGDAFKVIGKIGDERMLDMVMGAYQAKVLIGSTDEDNYEVNAKDFFGALSPAQLGASPLEISDGAKLAMEALTDKDALAALAALSVIKVHVSDDVAAKLTIYDDGTGDGIYSEEWIAQRGRMVSAFIQNDGVSNQTPTEYLDIGSSVDLKVGGSFFSERARIVFGSTYGDLASGDGLADSLFGMAGNDTLVGQAGNDWLEGGQGDDSLEGGEGRDILMGGRGVDILDGGGGIDQLRGGVGADKFVHSGGWGIDEVVDLDGGGRLNVEGFGTGLPAASIKVTDNVWRSQDEKVTFTRVPSDEGGYHLILSFKDKPDKIVLRDWEAGWFGINLGQGTEDRQTSRTYRGDQRALIIGNEVDLETLPTHPLYLDYKWSATKWLVDGTLDNGKEETGFSDAIAGSPGNDSMTGVEGNDELFGADGRDILDGGNGTDLLVGGKGNDWIKGGDGADYILGAHTLSVRQQVNSEDPPWAPPIGETIVISGDTWGVTNGPNGTPGYVYYIDGAVPTDTDGDLSEGGRGNDTVVGGFGADTLLGNGNDDVLWGLGGDDILLGGTGNDAVIGDGDSSNTRSIQYTPGSKNGADVIDTGAGNDTAWGGGGSDVLMGGDDDDELSGDWSGDTDVDGNHGQDLVDGGAGADIVIGGGNDDVLRGGAGSDKLWGDAFGGGGTLTGNDALEGGADDDMLFGGNGDDRLDGGSGNDLLYGGEGNDTLIGGLGVDAFRGEGGDDVYVIEAGEANGLSARAATTPFASTPAAIALDGSNAFGRTLVRDGQTASDAEETIADSEGSNTIQVIGGISAADNDSNGDLRLALGDVANGQSLTIANAFFGDVETLDVGGQVVRLRDWLQENMTQSVHLKTEGAEFRPYAFGAAGNDTLEGTAVNQDTLDGGWGDDHLYGLAAADSLLGAEGNDFLSAGDGDDTLLGGEGDDYLWAATGKDVIDGGAGNDTINAGGDAGDDVYLFGYGDGEDVATRASRYLAEVNTLTFKAGVQASDVVVSREYRLYIDDNGGQAGEFVDLRVTLASTGESILFQDFSRNDDPDLFGNPLQRIEFDDGTVWDLATICPRTNKGTMGDDAIKGFGGTAELLEGFEGNDSIHGNGEDTLLGGDGDDDLYGMGNDSVYGGAGNDYLSGDYLEGGVGDDVLSEGSWMRGGDGNDDLSMYSYIERATLEGGSGDDELRGGSDNIYLGGAGNDEIRAGYARGGIASEESHAVIRGGTGDDAIHGELYSEIYFDRGDGRDTYWGYYNESGDSNSAERATLTLGSGIAVADIAVSLAGDSLVVSLGEADAITLGGYFTDDAYEKHGAEADISIGTLAFNTGEIRDIRSWFMSGTNGPNTMVGTAGNDVMAGYLGFDKLDGGLGDDGLHGGVGDDTLTGGDGNDTLVGYTGRDSLIGGAGDDVYYIDDMDPLINELLGGGVDTVMYGVARYFPVTEYTLRSNFENLTLVDGITANGNSLDNRLVGNASNNWLNGYEGSDTLAGDAGDDDLDGGVGSDSMEGGAGNDIYRVDDLLDKTVEAAGAGIDTVSTGIGWQLGFEIENLQLTGSAAVVGLGNGLDNALTGNDGANTLQGLDGDDTLDGGRGADKLDGGKGADTYEFALGSGKDTVVERDSSVDVRDQAVFTDLDREDVNFIHVGNNLEARIKNAADKLVFKDWYLGSKYQVEDFVFADGTYSSDQVDPGLNPLIDAMAGFWGEWDHRGASGSERYRQLMGSLADLAMPAMMMDWR
jgi:Ca2+-binding RTX toxin-like protein